MSTYNHTSEQWASSSAAGRVPYDRRLVVVSNRQPYSHDYDENGELTVDRPTGGLTASLDPVLRKTGGTWIAWGDGDADAAVVDEEGRVGVPPDDPNYTLQRVWLSDEQVEDYYYGYSNQVLWPLCHSALGTIRADSSFWPTYRHTNEQFAEAVVEAIERSANRSPAVGARSTGRPLVWLQDYHLALASRMIRRRLDEDAVLMQFWHVPWPAWDTYRACPDETELLRGLLGNDVLGFHTPGYRDNFLECVETALPDATVDWRTGEVTRGSKRTRVAAVPMGVPADRIQRIAGETSAESFDSSFRREWDVPPGAAIAVGVDRLDYSKGIPQRLRALEQLWETRPELRETLTYVQNASESRSDIPAYQRVQTEVNDLVERINRRFGTEDWQPIVYFTDRLSRSELYALYRHADVALVSSIRDGMNLVAREFVAAQVDEDGMLVLSDQAGACNDLGEYALTVSPFDVRQFADRIEEALTMPVSERQYRTRAMRWQVADADLDAWLDRHFALAASCRRARAGDWQRA